MLGFDSGDRTKVATILFGYIGLRKKEMSTVTWDDVDYRKGAKRLVGPRPDEGRACLVGSLETRDRSGDGAHLSVAEQRFWIASTPSLPLNGIVGETGPRITTGQTEPRAKLRAIYDWVVDNTFRDAATRGCGIGGVESMLRTESGSGPRGVIKQLGASGDVTHAQHCRAEMWLAGEGWFPVDPADVRKVVLEAKLPVDSPQVRAQRERLFGSWEMNWVAYNHATNIALPGASRPLGEHFLMYPCATTAAGELDQLSPDTFRYRITSREITV